MTILSLEADLGDVRREPPAVRQDFHFVRAVESSHDGLTCIELH